MDEEKNDRHSNNSSTPNAQTETTGQGLNSPDHSEQRDGVVEPDRGRQTHVDRSSNTISGASPHRWTASSILASRNASREGRPPKEKHRVRFNDGSGGHADTVGEPRGTSPSKAENTAQFHNPFGNDGADEGSTSSGTKNRHVPSPLNLGRGKGKGIASLPLHDASSIDITESPGRSDPPKRQGMFDIGPPDELDDVEEDIESDSAAGNSHWSRGKQAGHAAFRNAVQLSESLKPRPQPGMQQQQDTGDAKTSAPPSPDLTPSTTIIPKDFTGMIPLEKLNTRRKNYSIEDEPDHRDDEEDEQGGAQRMGGLRWIADRAQRLVRTHSRNAHGFFQPRRASDSALTSGQVTPDAEQGLLFRDPSQPNDVPRGVLAALLHLYDSKGIGAAVNTQDVNTRRSSYQHFREHSASGASTPAQGSPSPNPSPPSSGRTTPKRKVPNWRDKTSTNQQSTSSLSSLVGASHVFTEPIVPGNSPRPMLTSSSSRPLSTTTLDTIKSFGKKKHHDRAPEREVFIRDHIENLLARQSYIVDSCRALMRYGAPTHRLEEYLRKEARVLDVPGQFLYLPGCMIISFDDPDTHTTEVRLVKEPQAIDLGKLLDMHDIYKAVVHDKLGVREASEMLDELIRKKRRLHAWWCVLLYGAASACVGPFAFGARPFDLPIIFALGLALGYMQLIMAPKSDLFGNVFEVAAAVFTSFCARAFGSINNGNTFCFAALAQSSIALILPGYIVLCAALELQSRNIVAGSVRMVYAIIYSLFLGFGITVGTSLFGAMDSNATQATTCADEYFTGYWKFLFVPPFTLCLCLIHQAKWKQMPAMLFISFAGYVVNYFAALRFASNVQISNTFGALAIGLLGNLYSRFFQGMSAAALLPAIFVQVPSGIAASGSLISGITSADQILSNSTTSSSSNVTTVSSGTQAGASGVDVNSVVFNVAYTMIQVAVGLTVGLFSSALLVYYTGGSRKRSGLFSF